MCKKNFDYAITDISKGALKVRLVALNPTERYQKWLPLLLRELDLLNNPVSIAVGKGLKIKMIDLGYDPDHVILHYSWNNSKWIVKAQQLIEEYSSKNDFDNFEIEIKQFSLDLMERMGYTIPMIHRIFKNFSVKLPDWKKALLALYRYDFRNISG